VCSRNEALHNINITRMCCLGAHPSPLSKFLHWPSFNPCQLLFFASLWSARFYLTLKRKFLHLGKPICYCFALTQLPRKFIRRMTPTRRCFSAGSLCNCLVNVSLISRLLFFFFFSHRTFSLVFMVLKDTSDYLQKVTPCILKYLGA